MISDAILPNDSHPSLLAAMKELGCNRAVAVCIVPRPYTELNQCHNNVAKQVAMYGGTQVKGYYLAVSKHTSDWVAIKHSVWQRDNELIDITPVEDKRTYNVFIYGAETLYTEVYNTNNTTKRFNYEQDNSMEQERLSVL